MEQCSRDGFQTALVWNKVGEIGRRNAEMEKKLEETVGMPSSYFRVHNAPE